MLSGQGTFVSPKPLSPLTYTLTCLSVSLPSSLLSKSHRFGPLIALSRLWISMNGLAQVLGCLIMYGIGTNTSLSLPPWRTLFLVCGAVTCAAGVAFYLMMPHGPKDAWFLTPRERDVLSMRMAHDREGGDKTSFSTSQLKETMLDPKAWFVFWFGVLVTMQSPVLVVSLTLRCFGPLSLGR